MGEERFERGESSYTYRIEAVELQPGLLGATNNKAETSRTTCVTTDAHDGSFRYM